jgi:U3 small nucleolar RNA-associated protein 14
MGAKHRESKWAKGIKATGRAAWDQDALDGVTEMARRNEELRRRVEGKTVRDEDEDASDVPSEEDESEDESDVDNADDAALQRSLGKLKQNPFSTDTSKLGQMAFMQKAEAARRKQNDEDVERMRRELAGEDSESDAEVDNSTKVGRRMYGPGKDLTLPGIHLDRNEFEEQPGSDEEDVAGREDTATAPTGLSNGARKLARSTTNGSTEGTRKNNRKGNDLAVAARYEVDAPNPFLTKAKKEKKSTADEVDVLAQAEPTTTGVQPQPKSKRKPRSKSKAVAEPKETTVDPFLQQRITAADDDGWATVIGGQDEDEDDDQDALEDEGIDLELVLRNQALTAKGFAGDNVAAEFEAEKNATIQDEESTVVTTELPGWGAWTGDGMTAAQKKRNQGYKTVTKKEGIDADKRKDKKLDKVIINERRAKPTIKYLASQLPFPFENREQYERSLRVPKGKEWTTKKTFQDATKPRVIVKQGVIAPLRKPLI